ncbi:MAG TPA: carbonic anhydrase, partial [Burkholderiales bacterium]|nr:carbonic anhydrase [Burkholderiales bacterium]
TAVLDDTRWKDVGPGPGSVHGKYVKWLTIPNLEASVVEDVQRIRSHPLVPGDIPIYGFVYDVTNGKLIEVKQAMEAGRARQL